jgi:hypothetical protein
MRMVNLGLEKPWRANQENETEKEAKKTKGNWESDRVGLI